MTKNADDIIAALPDFMRDNFERFNQPRAASPGKFEGNTRHGELALIALGQEDVDESKPAKGPALYEGKITPGIFSERGDEIAMWNNDGQVVLQLRTRSSHTYHGALAPALVAEGGFALAGASEMDLAFIRQTIRDVVAAAARSELPADDYNRTAFATALWTNPDRSGAAVPRAFVVMTWRGAGFSSYPTDAVLFDGDKLRCFTFQRGPGTSVRSPRWVGTAK